MIKIHCFLRFLQIVLSAAILSGGLAFAQSKPTDEYAALLYRGTQAEKQGRLNEAIEAFIPAYRIKQEYKVACTIARLAFRVQERRLIEAAEYYDLCKRTADRPKTKAGIARRIAELNELEVTKAHLITVELQAESGASIYVNNKFAGVWPLRFSLFLEPGNNVIEARKDGESIKREVEGTRGETLSLQLTRPALAPAAPVEAPASPVPVFTLPSFSPALEKEPARPPPQALRITPSPWDTARPWVIVGLSLLAAGTFGAGHYFEGRAVEDRRVEALNAANWAILRAQGEQERADEAAYTAIAAGTSAAFHHNLKVVAFVASGVAVAGVIPIIFCTGSPSSSGVSLAGSFVW